MRLLDAGFDPDREIVLHEAPDSARPGVEAPAAASATTVASRPAVTYEDSRHLVIEADAPQDGFLLLADTFYPGWTARVDGRPTPIYRANLSVRGIRLPKGRHEVRFTYDAPGFVRGLLITLLSVSVLLLWAVERHTLIVASGGEALLRLHHEATGPVQPVQQHRGVTEVLVHRLPRARQAP